MTTITVTLPDTISAFLDSQLKSQGINDPSEYIQQLLLEDQKKKEWTKLHKMLEEGLESGSSEMTQEDWREIREEVHQAHAERTRTL